MKKSVYLLLFVLSITNLISNTEKTNIKEKKENELQDNNVRLFYSTENSVSNIQFYNSNYGIFGHNINEGIGGTYWPRGSSNQYIFSAGVWFGAIKKNPSTNTFEKYCSYSYDPNNASYRCVPGSIDDGDSAVDEMMNQYRVYKSSDGYNSDGSPISSNNSPNWPLWSVSSSNKAEFGTDKYQYIKDINNRNLINYPLGTSIYSDEDMFTIFKDTDLNKYLENKNTLKEKGYPLKLETKQRILSWGSGIKKDVMVIIYEYQNKSTDTLIDCYLSFLLDPDLAVSQYANQGADNDKFRYVDELPYLNMGITWTGLYEAEANKDFGYIGVSLLETPSVDENRYIKDTQVLYNPSEQIGTNSIRRFNLDQDAKSDSIRYNLMSKALRDGDYGYGDVRALLSTGPFNFRPGDKARFAVALVFALPSKGGEADGTIEDIRNPQPGNNKSLVEKMNDLRTSYYKNMILDVEDNIQSNIINIGEVFPNPTVKSVSINYNTESDDITKIGLYNQYGAELQSFYNDYEAKGNHFREFELNSNALSSGIYFLRIQSGQQIKSKTISILK